MRRRMTIHIDFDDEMPGECNGTSREVLPGVWEAQVNVHNQDALGTLFIGKETKFDYLSVLAHEVGHVLADFTAAPGVSKVRRAMKSLGLPMSHELVYPRGRMPQEYELGAEREAWDIAEKMGIKIDPLTKKVGLMGHGG